MPLCIIISLLPNNAKIIIPIENIELYSPPTQQAAISEQITDMNFGVIVYLSGVTLGFILLSINVINQYRSTKQSSLIEYCRTFDTSGVPVFFNRTISTPMLIGLFKPTIQVPLDFEEQYSPFQQRAIIRHELYHNRRKDVLWNVIANLVMILFWFNPLVWFGYLVFRQDQELSCDQAVMRGESLERRKEYAKAVLVSGVSSETFAIQTSFGRKGNNKMMQERIDNIKHNHSFSKAFALFAFGFATLLAALQLQANTQVNDNDSLKSQLVSLHNPIVRIEPVYPSKAKTEGIEGSVTLAFGIRKDGTVEDIRVITSQPENVFEQAAKDAVAKWRFVPHDAEGVVATRKIQFALN